MNNSIKTAIKLSISAMLIASTVLINSLHAGHTFFEKDALYFSKGGGIQAVPTDNNKDIMLQLYNYNADGGDVETKTLEITGGGGEKGQLWKVQPTLLENSDPDIDYIFNDANLYHNRIMYVYPDPDCGCEPSPAPATNPNCNSLFMWAAAANVTGNAGTSNSSTYDGDPNNTELAESTTAKQTLGHQDCGADWKQRIDGKGYVVTSFNNQTLDEKGKYATSQNRAHMVVGFGEGEFITLFGGKDRLTKGQGYTSDIAAAGAGADSDNQANDWYNDPNISSYKVDVSDPSTSVLKRNPLILSSNGEPVYVGSNGLGQPVLSLIPRFKYDPLDPTLTQPRLSINTNESVESITVDGIVIVTKGVLVSMEAIGISEQTILQNATTKTLDNGGGAKGVKVQETEFTLKYVTHNIMIFGSIASVTDNASGGIFSLYIEIEAKDYGFVDYLPGETGNIITEVSKRKFQGSGNQRSINFSTQFVGAFPAMPKNLGFTSDERIKEVTYVARLYYKSGDPNGYITEGDQNQLMVFGLPGNGNIDISDLSLDTSESPDLTTGFTKIDMSAFEENLIAFKDSNGRQITLGAANNNLGITNGEVFKAIKSQIIKADALYNIPLLKVINTTKDILKFQKSNHDNNDDDTITFQIQENTDSNFVTNNAGLQLLNHNIQGRGNNDYPFRLNPVGDVYIDSVEKIRFFYDINKGVPGAQGAVKIGNIGSSEDFVLASDEAMIYTGKLEGKVGKILYGVCWSDINAGRRNYTVPDDSHKLTMDCPDDSSEFNISDEHAVATLNIKYAALDEIEGSNWELLIFGSLSTDVIGDTYTKIEVEIKDDENQIMIPEINGVDCDSDGSFYTCQSGPAPFRGDSGTAYSANNAFQFNNIAKITGVARPGDVDAIKVKIISKGLFMHDDNGSEGTDVSNAGTTANYTIKDKGKFKGHSASFLIFAVPRIGGS